MIVNGVKLNENLNIIISLKAIFGINNSNSKQIISSLGLSNNIKIKELTAEQKIKLDKIITHYPQNFNLKRDIKNNIKNYEEINNYRGVRHSYKQPVRGQRTHTNSGYWKRLKKKNEKK